MKARLALVAALFLPLGLSAMPTAVEYIPSKISLKQNVKLGDGSVLPAGSYDVQIHYKGFGNTAEFWFFTGGVLKGKTNAEARGFPSTAPAGVAGGSQAGFLKLDGIKGESADAKHKDEIDYKEQKADDAALKIKMDSFPKVEDKSSSSAASLQSISWGRPGQAVQTGGSVKLSFDSSNSSAGFSATLPLAQK
jgi:hypothetical protein